MSDSQFIRLALRLARRGCGTTSPNPMVGAVLVKGGKIIGRGWHRRAGLPHAEIEALRSLNIGLKARTAAVASWNLCLLVLAISALVLAKLGLLTRSVVKNTTSLFVSRHRTIHQ